jgi:hypothetical protein
VDGRSPPGEEVPNEDRHAVGDPHAAHGFSPEHDGVGVIPLARARSSLRDEYASAVHLIHEMELVRNETNLSGEEPEVLGDVFGSFRSHHAKIERVERGRTHTASSRRKSVHEPGTRQERAS